MTLEIKEILNIILIPDLTNIINDYTLTPFEYYKLIDHKKYTKNEYLKYQVQYEISTAKQISKNYKSDQQIINDAITQEFKNDLSESVGILFSKNTNLEVYRSDITKKYQQFRKKL